MILLMAVKAATASNAAAKRRRQQQRDDGVTASFDHNRIASLPSNIKKRRIRWSIAVVLTMVYVFGMVALRSETTLKTGMPLLKETRQQQQAKTTTRVMQLLQELGGLESLCDATIYSDRISTCHNHDDSLYANRRRRLENDPICPEASRDSIPWGLSPKVWLWFNIVGSIFCVLAVALMSSMFLGFMTLDPLDLRIKIRASVDTEERENAAQLLPLVENHHRLLVTLLLADAVFYETMPLFLDNLFPSWAAILISVTVLLVVGEIIPSAIFTGPEQLRLAGRLTPLMAFFLKFFYPIAYPLIWLLDTLVPPEDPEEEAYNRGELSALVRIQYEEREEARRAVNFTGLVPSAGKVPYRQPHHGDRRISTVGPLKGKNNVLTVTDKSRGWRNLKREIMEAVEQRYVDSQDNANQSKDGDNSSTTSPLYPSLSSHGIHNPYQDWSQRRNRSTSIGSEDASVQSISTPPAYEQIAPPLHQAEVKMVEGALTMKTKCAWDVYTPLRRIFSVPYDMELDKNTIAEIYSEGYSRVPVYERLPPPNEHRQYAMRGILMTRQLIMIDWEDERPVHSLPLYFPPCISPRMNLVDVLQLLQKGGSHIAFVCAGPDLANKALEEERPIPIEAGFMGLVTLEDVLEAILQDKIYDEEDVSDRDLASALLTQWAAKILQRFYRKKVLAKAKHQQGIVKSASGDSAGLIPPTDAAAVAALATSAKLASPPTAPTKPRVIPNTAPSIPEEIDLEIGKKSAESTKRATERTPLLGAKSTASFSNDGK